MNTRSSKTRPALNIEDMDIIDISLVQDGEPLPIKRAHQDITDIPKVSELKSSLLSEALHSEEAPTKKFNSDFLFGNLNSSLSPSNMKADDALGLVKDSDNPISSLGFNNPISSTSSLSSSTQREIKSKAPSIPQLSFLDNLRKEISNPMFSLSQPVLSSSKNPSPISQSSSLPSSTLLSPKPVNTLLPTSSSSSSSLPSFLLPSSSNDIDSLLSEVVEMKSSFNKQSSCKSQLTELKEIADKVRNEMRQMQAPTIEAIKSVEGLRLVKLRTRGKDCKDKEWNVNTKNTIEWVSHDIYIFFTLFSLNRFLFVVSRTNRPT